MVSPAIIGALLIMMAIFAAVAWLLSQKANKDPKEAPSPNKKPSSQKKAKSVEKAPVTAKAQSPAKKDEPTPATKVKKKKKKKAKDSDDDEADDGDADALLIAKASSPSANATKVTAPAPSNASAPRSSPNTAQEQASENILPSDGGWTEVHKKKGESNLDEQAHWRAEKVADLRQRKARITQKIQKMEDEIGTGGRGREEKERESLEKRARLLEDLSRVNCQLESYCNPATSSTATADVEVDDDYYEAEWEEDWQQGWDNGWHHHNGGWGYDQHHSSAWESSQYSRSGSGNYHDSGSWDEAGAGWSAPASWESWDTKGGDAPWKRKGKGKGKGPRWRVVGETAEEDDEDAWWAANGAGGAWSEHAAERGSRRRRHRQGEDWQWEGDGDGDGAISSWQPVNRAAEAANANDQEVDEHATAEEPRRGGKNKSGRGRKGGHQKGGFNDRPMNDDDEAASSKDGDDGEHRDREERRPRHPKGDRQKGKGKQKEFRSGKGKHKDFRQGKGKDDEFDDRELDDSAPAQNETTRDRPEGKKKFPQALEPEMEDWLRHRLKLDSSDHRPEARESRPDSSASKEDTVTGDATMLGTGKLSQAAHRQNWGDAESSDEELPARIKNNQSRLGIPAGSSGSKGASRGAGRGGGTQKDARGSTSR